MASICKNNLVLLHKTAPSFKKKCKLNKKISLVKQLSSNNSKSKYDPSVNSLEPLKEKESIFKSTGSAEIKLMMLNFVMYVI